MKRGSENSVGVAYSTTAFFGEPQVIRGVHREPARERVRIRQRIGRDGGIGTIATVAGVTPYSEALTDAEARVLPLYDNVDLCARLL